MSTETTRKHVNLIWKIANLLRGDYKEHEYGDVILPFTVLTRLDSVLVDSKEAVLEISGSDRPERVKDIQYKKATGYPFWNTSKFTLKTLLNDADHLEENLTYYVERFAPSALEVMKAYDFFNVIERLDRSGLLYKVLEEFTDPQVDLHPRRVSNTDMGHIFEELIRRFSELSNETAGEHFTPREVISLMVALLFEPRFDIDRLCAPGSMASLYDPGVGTGGMLSTAVEYAHDLNESARIEVYGQELNPATYAVAKSDIMIKGDQQERIYFGNSLTNDKTAKGQRFDYMLCNPPFGVEWKKYADPIKKEAEEQGFKGRFGAGLPRISDGSFLFLQHMISKMKPYDAEDPTNAPGSRIAVVFNGSPLFTGSAGRGESEIRRWILENDWLEAIIGLPDQMFYNTGILTYIWVLSNRKEPRRKGRVQLIDATSFYRRMRKPLGEKRKELTDKNIEQITALYGDFVENEHSKIFNVEDFGFYEVTVERPLRLNFQVTEDRLEQLKATTAFSNLAKSRKRAEPARSNEMAAGVELQNQIIEALRTIDSSAVYTNREAFSDVVTETLKAEGVSVRVPLLRSIVAALGQRDPSADICVDRKGNPEPDSDLRDTEQIPMTESIEEYFEREVLPYAPDAWIETASMKVGYEIPFTRHFYQYQDLGSASETLSELSQLGADIQSRVSRLLGEAMHK